MAQVSASPSGRLYEVVQTQTPKRDVDLFGTTTVRIDCKREAASSGVPLLYLSAYADDATVLAKRVVAALIWLDGGDQQLNRAVSEATTTPQAAAYVLPEYVEDVDFSERLPIPEDVAAVDWKAWSAAMERRVSLARSSRQVAALLAANDNALKACPFRFRADLGKAINDAFTVTFDQTASA